MNSAGVRKGSNGILDNIPPGSRKMVQSLKEIVNSSEVEIYAMLKECNMDPNEAVSRLLTQDPFHEVKSKREKKKETSRDIPDYRLRGANNTYNRGARGGSDRYAGRGGSSHFSSTDSGSFHGKSVSKKENGTQGYRGSRSSASGAVNHQQTPNSGYGTTVKKLPPVPSTNVTAQSGQMSMADIVKMGTTMEKPVAPSTSSVSVAPAESETCNRGYQHVEENAPSENLGVQHDSVAGGIVQEDDSGVSSEVDDNGYEYQTQSHPVEHHIDEDDASSSLADFQQLAIDDNDQEASREKDIPAAVVIPDHLLIHAEECPQLSFGSFGSMPLSNNVEESSDVLLQNEHSDNRNTEFYGNEHLESTANENMVHTPNTENYEDSRQEVLKQENLETVQEHQYLFAYGTTARQQFMGYTHSIPSTFLAQSVSELDYQYAPFLAAPSMQTSNSNNDSSLGDETISMPEAVQGSGIPATQQTLPSNIATGPAIPQQLPVHAYSQPTMPTHYASMLGYSLMPQNYAYIPAAYQQTYAGNSAYQVAALVPQYRTSVSPSSLPQSATATASAYEFGNPTNVGTAGNLPLNQQSAPPTVTTLSYEDLLALQQQQQQQQQQHNEWHHGHGSRTMSGVTPNTYYNLQAQQQQHQLYRQQQQHYGSHGYQNFYQSQTETSLDRQQQNPRDGNGSQVGQPSNQTQQLWQNSY